MKSWMKCGAGVLLWMACSVLTVSASLAAPEDPKKPETGKTPPPERPLSLPLLDRNHHLGPGDTIDIAVENYPDYSKTVKLFTDGTFDYPVLGAVQAAGMTIKELTDRVIEGFRKELRRPVVYISLREVYVPPVVQKEIPKIVALGAVSRKGEMELPEPRPLRVVLALIGPAENADMRSIRVRYPDGSARTADFSRFAEGGAEAVADQDFEIKGGEEIILLEKPLIPKPDPIKVTVLGAVAKPGTFYLESGAVTILEILDKVGGPQPGAELERVEVTGPKHATKTLVNVEKYISGDVSANYISQQDDVVVVPSKPHKVLLVGEFAKKGWMAIREGDTLLPVYLSAGIGGNGDVTKCEIIRRGKDGKAIRRTIDIRDIEKQKRPDEKLMPDDVIFLPNKKQKKGIMYYLQNVLTPVWLLRSIAPVP